MKLNTGAFTLSLDCEGLWGMADNLKVVSDNKINSQSLASAYDVILSTLDKNQLKSTAAFVTCFASEDDAVREQWSLIKEMAELNPQWFKNILAAFENNKTEGWRGHKFYKSFSSAGHEMAWHGTTHQSLSDETSKASIDLELNLTSLLLKNLGAKPSTIIFPRNQVGNLISLKNFGFKLYRPQKPVSKAGRVLNLLQEFGAVRYRGGDLPKFENDWSVSTAGHFLNWPSGARSIVPPSITIKHWQSMLRYTAETGGHLHMWFHPHNLITAPKMIDSFVSTMSSVGELVRTGNLLSLTMEEANKHFTKIN